MVKTVNGDPGSSVIPIEGDDYMYLGRGRHVVLDDSNVHMNGVTGNTLAQGIEASQTDKTNQMRTVANAMKLMLLIEQTTSDDYMLTCDSGYAI